MRSLFARIWLSYGLVIALTLGAALAVAFALAVKRAGETDSLSPRTLAASAQAALTAKGTDGLRAWSNQEWHTHPELSIYFIDGSGHDLLSREVRGRALAGREGAIEPRITGPNGATYRILVRRIADIAFGFWQITLVPWVLIACAVLVSGAASAWLAHYLSRPMVRLRTGVRAIAAGNLDTRMGEDLARRKDELGGLARDFDQMAADLRGLIASKEGLLRDVSHELRSPLARLRVAAGLARRDAPQASAGVYDRIDLEVERLDGLIGQILRLSRLDSRPAPAREPVDLTVLVEQIVEDARMEAAASGKLVTAVVCDGPLVVEGDRRLLASAVENVLRNAVRFARRVCGVTVRRDGDLAWVEIDDDGPGVSAPDLARIFEPFFRADSANGVGLGLTIAQRVVRLHGGVIAAQARAQGGLHVTIRLPAADA